MADARCVGSGSPFLGQPDLALYANLLLGLHDLRLPHHDLVPGRRTRADQAQRAGVEPLGKVKRG